MRFCDKVIQDHLLAGGKVKLTIAGHTEYVLKLDNWNGWFMCISVDGAKNVFQYDLKKSDLVTDCWEIIPFEIDWNLVIKNKVLCKFYQNGLSEDYVIRGLANVSSNRFKDDLGGIWDCCEIIDQSEYKVAKSVESYYKKD